MPLFVGLPLQSPASSSRQSPIHFCHHNFAFSGTWYHWNQTVWTLIFKTHPPPPFKLRIACIFILTPVVESVYICYIIWGLNARRDKWVKSDLNELVGKTRSVFTSLVRELQPPPYSLPHTQHGPTFWLVLVVILRRLGYFFFLTYYFKTTSALRNFVTCHSVSCSRHFVSCSNFHAV